MSREVELKLFKSKGAKEAEQRSSFVEFLRCDEARQSVFELLTDTRLRGEVDIAVEHVKQQLLSYLDAEIRRLFAEANATIATATASHREQVKVETASLRQQLHAEREAIADHAKSIRRDLKENLAEHEQDIVAGTRLSMAGVIHDTLAADLHRLLRREVKTFIRTHPIGSGLSNREIAAVNGISIREVKRRRRAGAFSDHPLATSH